MLPKAIAQEKVLQIGRPLEPAFSAVIVDRDSMGSDLLVNALVHNLRCDAVAVRSSDLLQVLGARNVDLVIISADLSARLGVGFDLANAVSCAHPKIPIVILLDQPPREAVINAFRSGARGVFDRQASMSEFIDCVKHVRKGFIWAGREETNFVLEAFKSISAPIALTVGNSSTLTKRELQVVQCAAAGKTNKTIASELGLSDHTVKNYLFRAFEKLGVSSRVELLFHLTTHGRSFESPRAEQDEANAAE
jgi:two-component system nitrate/nitrite response regulator NarL